MAASDWRQPFEEVTWAGSKPIKTQGGIFKWMGTELIAKMESAKEGLEVTEVCAIRATLSEICSDEVIERFAEVWKDIGLEEGHRKDRRETIRKHLLEMLTEMLNEELALKQKLHDSVNSCAEEVQKLAGELGIRATMPGPEVSLLLREKDLRSQVDAMNKEKHDRLKRLKRLTEMDSSISVSLGREPQLLSVYQSQVVPKEEDLLVYRRQVEEMEKIKDTRQVEFFSCREAILKLWSSLDQTAIGGFEETVRDGDTKHFVLSEDNMDSLHQLKAKLEEKDQELTNVIFDLRADITSLWTRLEVPASEQELFLNNCDGPKPSIIVMLETELIRLEELKRVNMQKFIEATRVELVKVWDQCFFGHHQRQEFSSYFEEVFNDDALSAHESELDRMKGFYADNAAVFKLVSKREKLWKQWLDFESKTGDPSRLFNDRGGKLQKELKQRNTVSKELPKVEAELQKVVAQWERDCGREFLVHDARYLDTINSQWKHQKVEKEVQKALRQKAKAEITAMEMTYGSNPGSPTKRKAAAVTPANLPPKIRKVAQSPLVHSTQNSTKTATSRVTRSRAAAAGSKTPKKLTKNSTPRKILADQNTGTILPHSSETFLCGHPDTSLASTVSTYSEFQRGLAVGFEVCKTARSSFLPKSSSSESAPQ